MAGKVDEEIGFREWDRGRRGARASRRVRPYSAVSGGLAGHRWQASGKALPAAPPAGSSVAMRVVMDEPVDEPDGSGAGG
jgi:hypothetical protein